MSNLPTTPQSQPPETPPWDTPSSRWFSPISTPWRTTPRSKQSTPTPTTPIALTEVVVSKSPLSQKSHATPSHDGIESEPLNDTMVLLRLRTTRTNPWIWCGAALCFLFSVLLIIFGIATLALFLALRPRTPVFDITNAKLNTIYFESPVYFNGDMLLLLNFTNPNKKLAVRFDHLTVELWFADKKIATQGVLPFKQRNGKTRLEPIRLISNLVFLPVNHLVELKRQLINNQINYEIRSMFRVRAVLGIIHYSYWLHGSCQLQLASPPTGGLISRNSGWRSICLERESIESTLKLLLQHVIYQPMPWKASELKCVSLSSPLPPNSNRTKLHFQNLLFILIRLSYKILIRLCY